MIRTDCYLAKLEWFRFLYKDAHFEIITRSEQHVLSPSPRLLCLIKANEISWEQYTVLFINEIFSNDAAMEKIEELRRLSIKKKDLFLVCYEKNAERCHRSIVAKLIRHEYVNFAESYSKLNCLQFSTIRAQSHGVIADNLIYILIKQKYVGLAKVTTSTHMYLCDIPDRFLLQDTEADSRESALTKIDQFYPGLDFFAILIMKWVQKVGGVQQKLNVLKKEGVV